MRLIAIVFILLLCGLFITIMPNIFGEFETQHNMTAYQAGGLGSNYTAQYNALTDITLADLRVIAGIGVLLVLAMVFLVVKIITR